MPFIAQLERETGSVEIAGRKLFAGLIQIIGNEEEAAVLAASGLVNVRKVSAREAAAALGQPAPAEELPENPTAAEVNASPSGRRTKTFGASGPSSPKDAEVVAEANK